MFIEEFGSEEGGLVSPPKRNNYIEVLEGRREKPRLEEKIEPTSLSHFIRHARSLDIHDKQH